jgi:hypothetical protein
MAITATTARYINLDTESQEISTLDLGNIHLSEKAVRDELARDGAVTEIEQYLLQRGYSPLAAADGAQKAKDFYGLGVDCLWITFARDHLWWTFADPEVVSIMKDFELTDERVRSSVGGWCNTNIRGTPLKLDELGDRILRLATIRPGDIDAEALSELLRLINGTGPKAGAQIARSDLRSTVIGTPGHARNDGTVEVPSTLFTVGDVIKKPSAAPDQAGIYAWWFDELPNVPLQGAWEQGGFRLAYIGIASHRPGSRRTLRQRLHNHCKGPIATSTLRRSLAAVLIDELDLHAFVRAGKVKLPDAEETRLSDWLAAHGRVAWIANATPWVYETELLQSGPPLALNIRGNNHAFVEKLLALRQQLSNDAEVTSG